MLGKLNCYVVRLSIFLITAPLIAGTVGCINPPPFPTCNLTIASTAGGSVTTPGEGTFTYPLGYPVNLVAVADEGYRFVDWTGDVGTIADVEAATTTINMEYYYSITANFAPEALEIRNWYDLDAIRDNLDGSYVLMNDLNSTTAGYQELASPTANDGKGWQPVGTDEHSFTGSLDGQGYQIRDLFINRPGEDHVGLFAIVDEGGRIEGISVMNTTVTGYHCVGGLVGANVGAVRDSYSSSSVGGFEGVGGLVGYNGGTVSNSYSGGNVTGERSVGGLMGENQGTVNNSYSSGNVTGVGWVGGLAGYSAGTVSNSYSSGSVTGSEHVGGLVGENWFGGTVSNCYSTGNVTGIADVGGLVGYNSFGTVSNSYSTGNVAGSWGLGGLVGENGSTVSDSFWDTETSGQTTSAGGTGRTTAAMKSIATFSGAGWNITAVAPGETNPAYIWNIVDNVTCPFLSWEL
jgi:hypothetical protein